MPASKSGVLSEKELEQREQAAVKHGAFSKKMTPSKVGRLAELEEQLSTRPGLVEVQREQTAKAVEVANVLLSYVITEHRKGKSLDRIPAMNRLSAYMNTAGRQIKQLWEMLPDEQQTITISDILKDIREGDIKPDDNSGD